MFHSGRAALTEPIMTIAPPRASMCGSAARVVRTAASRLSDRLEAQSSSVTEAMPPNRVTTVPALFTRTSTPPRRAASATSSREPPGAARSAAMKQAEPAASSAASSGLLCRAPATTNAPAAASAVLIARPMPRLAPVTTATLPVRCRSMPHTVRLA